MAKSKSFLITHHILWLSISAVGLSITVLFIYLFLKTPPSDSSLPLPAVLEITPTQIPPTLTPTPTIIPTPSPTPTKPPARFSTLPPGSRLPTGEECAQRVRRSSWEPRPENHAPNHHIAVPGQDYDIIVWGPNTFGQSAKADTLRQRINGKFTGTTDEILQWASCKWGIDEDMVRAQAVQESTWRMSTLGDHTDDNSLCSQFGKSAPCDQSYGLLQVKASVHKRSYPAAQISSAFNVDYAYAYWRTCFEGNMTWLKAEKPDYHAGDAWGCFGHWYSGSWYTEGANKYIGEVKSHLNTKRWTHKNF